MNGGNPLTGKGIKIEIFLEPHHALMGLARATVKDQQLRDIDSLSEIKWLNA